MPHHAGHTTGCSTGYSEQAAHKGRSTGRRAQATPQVPALATWRRPQHKPHFYLQIAVHTTGRSTDSRAQATTQAVALAAAHRSHHRPQHWFQIACHTTARSTCFRAQAEEIGATISNTSRRLQATLQSAFLATVRRPYQSL